MTARWTCDEVEPKLTSYRLGELPPAEEAAITLHLETCEACRAASEDILDTLSLLDEAFSAETAPLTVLPAADEPVAPATIVRLRGFAAWLGLPADRTEWLGSFARAALILILPLTLVLGLLLPGLRLLDGRDRMAAHLKEIEAFTNAVAQAAMRAAEAPTPTEGYEVALGVEPDVIEVDSVESPGLAHAFREGVDILTGTVEVAADFWSGESHAFEAPVVAGVGLSDALVTNAAALVRATETTTIRLPRPVVPVEQVVTVLPPERRKKHTNKPRLIETVASHPGYNLTNTPVRTGSESEKGN